MIKSWMHDITLSIQARSGASPALFAWVAVIVLASLTAFIFLCVTGYDWLSLQFGSVYAGLVMVAIFVLIAVVAAIVCTLTRRRAMERAILARAARAHAPSWWLDPKILAAGMQAGRALGWQKLVPIALLGFMAAQWAREHREHTHGDGL
jgi:hypothetical protein